MTSPQTTAHHVELVQVLSKPGGPLGLDAPTATVNNPQWFELTEQGVIKRPTVTRGKLHEQIMAVELARCPNVAKDRKAIVLAGPPGAGKDATLKRLLGPELDTYLVIDPDEIKKTLIQAAITDGSFEQWIKPAQLKALETQGERFAPLELASLVHEESSKLAEWLRLKALRDGLNTVVNTVLSDQAAASKIGELFAAYGYQVEVVDVEVPFEVSASRIQQRWQDAYARWLEDTSTLGGRWVPSQYARALFDQPDGKSRTQVNAKALADQCSAVVRYRLFDNSANLTPIELAQPPTPLVDLSRLHPDRPLLDTQVT